MNNRTKQKFVIKMREDNLYYLYINENCVAVKGHYKSILEELEKAIERFDNKEYV